MMHSEPIVSTTLPPPLPLSYEQDLKSNAFLDFTHPPPPPLLDPLDSPQQQYSNFIHHPSYHQVNNEDQFYSTGRSTYPSYPYPYALPPYPSLTLETGLFRSL